MNVIKDGTRLFVGAGMVLFTCAFPGFAASTNVFVGAGGTLTFSPNNLTINAGDQIIWTWQGNSHSTTSGTGGTPSGFWDSGVSSQPHSFTNTFNSTGSFPYYCSVHVGFGMTGVVNVAPSGVPPSVSITNPPDGATLSAPASFALTAQASDSDGTVTGVQFFQGTTSLGTVASSPYTVALNNLGAGDYGFSAVATDNTGLKATNAITIHIVTPVAIMLSAAEFLPPGHFRFNYTANSGLKYIVQRSGDLSSGVWTTLGTNQAASSSVTFDDTNAAGNAGFYRVGRLPNP